MTKNTPALTEDEAAALSNARGLWRLYIGRIHLLEPLSLSNAEACALIGAIGALANIVARLTGGGA